MGKSVGRAVTDPVGAQAVDRLPDALRPLVLAGVDRQPEAAAPRDLVGVTEQARRVASLGPGQVKADDAGALVQMLGFRQRLAGDDLGDVGSVLPHGDDDESHLQVGMPTHGIVHPREHRSNSLSRCEARVRVDRGE